MRNKFINRLFLTGLFLLISISFARANDLYVVDLVNVDVTSSTAASARKTAIDEGYRKAFNIVVNRLALKRDLDSSEIKVGDDLSTYISEFSVLSEKTSDVRYIAELRIVFNPKKIKKLLNENFIPFTEEVKSNTLLIPLFYASPNADPVLWEDDNLLLRSFRSNRIISRISPLIIPNGDMGDRVKLTTAMAKNMNAASFARIAEGYNVSNVVVAKAVLYQGGKPKLDISLNSMLGDVVSSHLQKDFDASIGVDGFYKSAVVDIVSRLEEDWKAKNVVNYNESLGIVVMIKVDDLQDWVAKEKLIKSIPVIKECKLQAITKKIAQISLSFSGDIMRVQDLLAGKGLSLIRMDNVWVIE